MSNLEDINISNKEALDIAFKDAVDRVNKHLEPFPADFLLRIYAYYKKANNDVFVKHHQSKTIIDGFKMNALLQVNNVTPQEAKQKYVELVNSYFLYGKSK